MSCSDCTVYAACRALRPEADVSVSSMAIPFEHTFFCNAEGKVTGPPVVRARCMLNLMLVNRLRAAEQRGDLVSFFEWELLVKLDAAIY